VKETPVPIAIRLLPVGFAAVIVGVYALVAALKVFPESAFPPPAQVWAGLGEEIAEGRLLKDVVASLYRVAVGFSLAIGLALPVGLGMGHSLRVRATLLPIVNFFRNLSPLAWISFSILWFGVGDRPTIFLIFLATFFPTVLAVSSAVAEVPRVYSQVGRDFGFSGIELFTRITLPAILPQFITTLRVGAGVAWMVVVAAEMVSGSGGLGFAILDDRNGLRTDLLVVHMLVIGTIGVLLDRLLVQLARDPSVRWGYEK
jgi:NitT/TauT family transport system permease protein